MSADQLDMLDEWKRPSDALPPPFWPSEPGVHWAENALHWFMKSERAVDLVQDAAADCSVVASMSAGMARAERGHAEVRLVRQSQHREVTVITNESSQSVSHIGCS